ncbi:MAG: GIY-YIG nuclease family protein [Patescibacteria group bacterium]|nr:GIY-YIG nuclease family protein [Patescibacteria group bacterium]
MWFVYILKSKIFNKYYIGCTRNLQRRIWEHNAGLTISVKRYIPYELVYFEKYNNQEEAYKREKQIKSYKGGNAFKRLIKKHE